MHCKTDEERNEYTKLIEEIKKYEKLILLAKQAVDCYNHAVKMYKEKNYVEAKKYFEEAAKKFEEKNRSIYCRDLKDKDGPQPLICCVQCVEDAAALVDEFLKEKGL